MENDGIVLVDKDFGLTSFEATARLKNILQAQKAGHTGTLDPYATGLLIIAVGRATKIASFLSSKAKRYLARLRLGQVRDTFDRFGRVLLCRESAVGRPEIEQVLTECLGTHEQLVPPFSAAHHKGRRLYEYARAGKILPPKYSAVTISQIKLIAFDWPFATIEVECSAGTYVRSLAHRVGERLGCGGILHSLRRLAVGSYDLSAASTLQQIAAGVKMRRIADYLIPINAALDLPRLIVAPSKVRAVQHGQEIHASDLEEIRGVFGIGDLVSVRTRTDALLAVARACRSSEKLGQRGNERLIEYMRVL